jgi:hypothetical protein
MPPSVAQSKGANRRSPFHLLPAEACKGIAEYTSLGRLAKFCVLSREARQFFSPVLYTSIDSLDEPGALLATLANFQKFRPAAWGTHPAALVRELRIWLFVTEIYTAVPAEKERHEKRKEWLRRCSVLL